MKKIILFLFIIVLIVGCSQNTNKNSDVKNTLNIEGYWLEILRDDNGKEIDLSNRKIYFLTIENDEISFINYYEDTETSSEAKFYYKVVNNILYYDTEKIDEKNLDNIFRKQEVKLEDELLILKETTEGSYTTHTYKRVNKSDVPS